MDKYLEIKEIFESREDKETNIKVNNLINELAKKENVSIYPDGKEPLSWTQKMNNIKNRAEGIVLNEGIFCL